MEDDLYDKHDFLDRRRRLHGPKVLHPQPRLLLLFRTLLGRPELGELVREAFIKEVPDRSDYMSNGEHGADDGDGAHLVSFNSEETKRAKSFMTEKFQAHRVDRCLTSQKTYWLKRLTSSSADVVSSLVLCALPNLQFLTLELDDGDIKQMVSLFWFPKLRELDLMCSGDTVGQRYSDHSDAEGENDNEDDNKDDNDEQGSDGNNHLCNDGSRTRSGANKLGTKPQNQNRHSASAKLPRSTAFTILRFLLSTTKSLKTLCYEEFASCDCWPTFNVQEYGELVATHKDTLEETSLALTVDNCVDWRLPQESTSLDGSVFGSMHDFTNLRKLYIQLEVLLGDPGNDQGYHHQLKDVLPPQLVQFNCFSVQRLDEVGDDGPGIWGELADEQFADLENAVHEHPKQYALSSVSMHVSRRQRFHTWSEMGLPRRMSIEATPGITYRYY